MINLYVERQGYDQCRQPDNLYNQVNLAKIQEGDQHCCDCLRYQPGRAALRQHRILHTPQTRPFIARRVLQTKYGANGQCG
jgi:hypothetical protein